MNNKARYQSIILIIQTTYSYSKKDTLNFLHPSKYLHRFLNTYIISFQILQQTKLLTRNIAWNEKNDTFYG